MQPPPTARPDPLHAAAAANWLPRPPSPRRRCQLVATAPFTPSPPLAARPGPLHPAAVDGGGLSCSACHLSRSVAALQMQSSTRCGPAHPSNSPTVGFVQSTISSMPATTPLSTSTMSVIGEARKKRPGHELPRSGRKKKKNISSLSPIQERRTCQDPERYEGASLEP
ncbi:uncharacterized protein LOC123440260 [Hordeum vulgare subsp. vulgare]|uniref:uncharacterized protein LOC123440260 n=1 Tax=Hordeum vulgare subsp. vulgare TaxID=112509 RepID=UPI001D1A4C32|nr:uncharacterized protein LOC123440260 [Hordeum vulgare subsp. vulgare]